MGYDLDGFAFFKMLDKKLDRILLNQEILAKQSGIQLVKDDFIIFTLLEASKISNLSIPTIKKAIQLNILKEKLDYKIISKTKNHKIKRVFSYSSLENLKGQI